MAHSVSTSRLPLLLAKAGYRVELIGPADERAGLSRHLAAHQKTKRDFENFAAALAERLKTNPPDSLVWGDDRTIESAQRHPDPVFDQWWPTDSTKYPKRCVSYKTEFEIWARDKGLPIPLGGVANSMEEAAEMVREWGVGVIVKPSRGSAGYGIFRAANADEMIKNWNHKTVGPWVVQEFVEGRNCILQFAAHKGKLLMALSGERTMTNGEFSYSIRRRYEENPKATELMERLVSLTGFTGVGGGDAILRADGSVCIVELTLRPTPGLHLIHHEGVPFDQILRETFGMEEAKSPAWTKVKGGTIWPMFPEVLRSTLDRNKVGEFLVNLVNPSMWRGITWGDPPLVKDGWILVGQCIRSVWIRIWRRIRRGGKAA